MPDADEIFSPEELASLPVWPDADESEELGRARRAYEEPPLECPECEHDDLDHDETGCTVIGCPCTGP